ncbi:MAG: hypothetical protein IJW71_06885 [Clostridia bacterium]|nr:hypothetical protein [Clostridia bacterium]MBQ9773580.1 hypothetical protein [Clostridia bacterium]
MKITKRIISTLLAVILMLGALSAVLAIPSSAAAEWLGEGGSGKNVRNVDDYLKPANAFTSPEEKLNEQNMVLMYIEDSGRYRLYANELTGEVVCQDTTTGQLLFTNPYDAAKASTESTRAELLSQIVIYYSEADSSLSKPMYSFEHAAQNGQIAIKTIKNGIRVEYTIGREATKKLVPRLILGDDFQLHILDALQEAVAEGEMTQFEYDQVLNRWNVIDVGSMKDYIRADWLTRYPFLKTEYEKTGVYPLLYQFDSKVSESNVLKTEEVIKRFTEYTFDQMEADHERTGYVEEEEVSAAFKLALEYYADENGMTVRMPSNGLRYNMEKFQIQSINILPYMGAGNYMQDGYAFFPDGAGALFDYKTMRTESVSASGYLYGEDYAYYDLLELKYERVVRYPVFGLVSTESMHNYTYTKGSTTSSATVSALYQDEASIRESLEKNGFTVDSFTTTNEKRGFVAIVEEGDAMSEIKLEEGGSKHKFAYASVVFNKPVPYDVDEGGHKWSSDRKYTGNISIRYIMLCEDDVAAEAKKENPDYNYYTTSWVGMAKAYRDYLDEIEVLARLEAEDVEEDIPLYIESFGGLETQETIATIPVYVMTPLTTFDNVLTMYKELAANDVKNINFKMTGFANGGMYYKVPSSLKWEKKLGGKDGFNELIAAAKKINEKEDGSHLGLYPDFDFAYIQDNTLFDAVSLKKDAIKTMDNRYTNYRQYSPTQQTFVSFYQLAISPSRYSKFYTKLLENYAEYDIKTISVASLGTTLNSDFDEEDPYNREESKEFTEQALSYIKNKGYSIMTDGANAYTWGYVDHIMNVDLDSSRRLVSSASVPFIGVVLHGYVQFTGAPLNEEGDANYAMLRAIENGASLNFLLSYQNTAELKNDPVLSQYYSIRYDIWLEDVISYYHELNDALSDVQTKLIIDHQFLPGERVLTLEELQAEIAEKLEEAERLESEANHNQYIADLNSASDAWALLYGAEAEMQAILKPLEALTATLDEQIAACEANLSFETELQALTDAKNALASVFAQTEAAKEAMEAARADMNAAADALSNPADGANLDILRLRLAQARGEFNKAQSVYDDAVLAQTEATNTYNAARDEILAGVLTHEQALYEATVALIDSSVSYFATKAEADQLMTALDAAIQLVVNSTVYEGAEKDAVVAEMNAYRAQAQACLDVYATYAEQLSLNADNAASVGARASNAVAGLRTYFNDETLYTAEEKDAALAILGEASFDLAALQAYYETLTALPPEDEEEAPEQAPEEGETVVEATEAVANNRIVAVTYGDTTDDGSEVPYKTFILNYNSYTVRVTFKGVVYTVKSGEYAVVTYENN